MDSSIGTEAPRLTHSAQTNHWDVVLSRLGYSFRANEQASCFATWLTQLEARFSNSLFQAPDTTAEELVSPDGAPMAHMRLQHS